MTAAATPWLPALPPFLAAGAVCIAALPVSIWLARRTGAVAEPDADRHIHSQPTPRLGGIAMFLGFAVAVAAFGSSIQYRWQVVAVCGAITIAMALDDIFDLSWKAKLTIEVGGGVLVALAGVLITFIAVPGLGSTSVWQLGWLAAPITIAWIAGMEVSVNFLDGADGVAAGVVAIVAAVLLLAAINRLHGPGDVQSGVIVMSGAIMGCCLGFLVFNLPPARVFMGDSGSHFLGVALGMLTILGVSKIVVGLSLLVPIIALGLPITDTAYAIVRRKRAGRSPAEPDAGHLHHRLLARGMTPLETALTFYLATGILGCIALSIYGHRKILDAALALLVLALAALFWRSRRRHPTAVILHDDEFDLQGRGTVRSSIRRGEAD
ncbi:MAG: undecaprenyl/decaprenyl-phosphate alpha-N-acetylglucosaminyl 1-phosphate transferase [Candidatus Dormibacteraeota bacterium]|nr:undecaprenyl/decaprenyl-phosphate alpha-N-acetylglucosaminyl 1-phosphate transferase [Candidatus Dormibacteraeota bacterium]